jgi:hypothetical protein
LAFANSEALDCLDFVGAILVPGWVLSFAACAFVSFAMALGGWVVFAAFGANVMKASTFRGMMSKLLAFEALNQLKLRHVFVWVEPSVVNVESVLDAVVCHICGCEEHH